MPSEKISIERNSAILYSVVIVSIITFVVIWLLQGSSQVNHAECIKAHPCSQSDTKPVAGQMKLWKLSSDDHKALVHIKGYLQFDYNNRVTHLDNKKYLPLDLRSVTWQEQKMKNPLTNKDTTTRSLTIETSCASIKLHYTNNLSETKWKFTNGTMSIDLHGMGALYYNCGLDSFSEFERYTHYRCPKPFAYNCRTQCSADSVFQVQLHLEQFEYEVNGKPDQLKDDQFSKPGHECNKFGNESDLSP